MTPTEAENYIYDKFNSKKLNSCIFRFQDTRDATARSKSGKTVILDRNPSDFVMTRNGVTAFVEVKTTESVRGTNENLFKQQAARRDMILNCGGKYIYFIYSNKNLCWFVASGDFIRENPNRKWNEFERLEI